MAVGRVSDQRLRHVDDYVPAEIPLSFLEGMILEGMIAVFSPRVGRKPLQASNAW